MIKYFTILPKTNIDFTGRRKFFFALSALIMIACAASVVTRGLNYGIDFTGGTMVQAQFKGDADIQDVRKALSGEGLSADIQTYVGKNAFSIKIKGDQNDVNEVTGKIDAGLKTLNVPFEIESSDFVGPTVGSHLAKKAFLAFALAVLAMIVYIAFRFQNIVWGVMAIVALVHDVFVAVGVLSFLRLEVDLVIVAALLTIAGFSVNDSIVVFDRARENIRLNPKWNLGAVLNTSVNDTLSRAVITSLTVVSSAAILLFAGGPVLRNFSLTILIGLVSGVYTTVCLVPGLVYQWTGGDNTAASAPEQSYAPAADESHNAHKKKNKKRYG